MRISAVLKPCTHCHPNPINYIATSLSSLWSRTSHLDERTPSLHHVWERWVKCLEERKPLLLDISGCGELALLSIWGAERPAWPSMVTRRPHVITSRQEIGSLSDIQHVRRDGYSVSVPLLSNDIKPWRFWRLLAEAASVENYFPVSSSKCYLASESCYLLNCLSSEVEYKVYKVYIKLCYSDFPNIHWHTFTPTLLVHVCHLNVNEHSALSLSSSNGTTK